MNYGERIAYWYFRLNGFFMLEDFVLHAVNGVRTSHADILAIRLMDCQEQIGGCELDPDAWFAINDLSLSERHVAVIVQVKTGQDTSSGMSFLPSRLDPCIRRLGICPPERVIELVDVIHQHKSINTPDGCWSVAKILVAEHMTCQENCHFLPLQDAVAFIRRRFRDFSNRKLADRMFFPDPLIQFLAWDAVHHG